MFVRALKLTYAMEQSQQDLPKIPELTGLLVKSEYITNPAIENELPEANVASLLTMHQLGLSWRHEWDEAGRVCLQIMDRFYPQTLSGASAAMNFGLYLWMRQRDLDGAERMFKDILDRAPYDGITPHVERLLAKLYAKQKRYDESLALLDKVIERIDPSQTGPLGRCRKKAVRLREAALQLKASGGIPPQIPPPGTGSATPGGH